MQFPIDETQEKRALYLHFNSLVIDMHTDVHLNVIRRRGQGERRVFERIHLPRWRKAGIDTVILSSMPKYGPEQYPYYTSPAKNSLMMIDAIHQELAESPEHFALILTPDDIVNAKKEGRIGFVIGMEGAECVEQDLALLRCYHRLGLRIMNLTWHQRNLIADGVAEPSNSGLSNFGRDLVKEMNRLGIIIDVSHLSRAAVKDVLELSEQPIIASHSCAYALCDHQRNLEDWQIEGIAKKGGMIGIVFLGNFVAKENPNVSDVIDHIDYMSKLIGSLNIGTGPDYTDFCQDMIIPTRRVVKSDLPVDATTIPYAEGVEDMVNLVNLTRGLISRGYRDEEIRGILGENFLRVFRSIYKVS